MLEQLELNLLAPSQQVTLFPYQEQVIKQVNGAIANGHRAITVAAATGSGKTVIASSLIKEFLNLGQRVLFIVHRDVLISQTLKTLERFGISAGVIAGGYNVNESARIQIASYQTLARRNIDWFPWNIAIFDEAHITSWTSWGKKTLQDLGNRYAVLLTATPFRLSKRESFSQISDLLVKAPSLKELIEMERLSKPRYLVAGTVDTSKVRTQAGEFSSEDLSVLCDNEEVISNFCRALQTHAKGRLTLAFAVGVEHARRIAAIANHHGIKAAHVDGEMSREHRRELYDALATRKLDLLASCEALAEGFDVPNVDCVGLLRPTKSKAKYIQQIGRGLRAFPGKEDCLILCQSGNVHRFGFVEDIPIKFQNPDEKEPGVAPMKVCREIMDGEAIAPGCESTVYAFLKSCPHCGGTFPSKDEEKVKFTGEFQEITRGRSKTKTKLPKIDLDKIWQEVIPHIYPMTTQALLKQHGRIDGYKGNTIQISIKSLPLLRMVQGKEKNIEEAFKQLGLNVQVAFKTPAPSSVPKPLPKRQDDPWQEVIESGATLVSSLISAFLK